MIFPLIFVKLSFICGDFLLITSRRANIWHNCCQISWENWPPWVVLWPPHTRCDTHDGLQVHSLPPKKNKYKKVKERHCGHFRDCIFNIEALKTLYAVLLRRFCVEVTILLCSSVGKACVHLEHGSQCICSDQSSGKRTLALFVMVMSI